MNSHPIQTLEKADSIQTLGELRISLEADMGGAPEAVASALRETIQALDDFQEPAWGLQPEERYVERFLSGLRGKLERVF